MSEQADEIYKVTRVSPRGLKFTLYRSSYKETCIQLGNNAFIVKQPIEILLRAWYKWQILGMFIQDAFSMLDDEEREFILTGITPEQWHEMFGKDEEDGSN